LKNFIGQSKPAQAPYYAKKTSGQISKETKKEFPDIKVIKSDSVTLNGYSLPVENKLYIKTREMELKNELKDLKKELKSIHRHDMGTAILFGVMAIGCCATVSPLIVGLTVGSALFAGGGLVAGLASSMIEEERSKGDTPKDLKKELAQNYDNGRMELDHLKKSEIYWPGEERELSPREKCLSMLNELKKDTVKLSSSYDGYISGSAKRMFGISTGKIAVASVDDFFEKKYPELYDAKNDKYDEEHYEKLHSALATDVICFRVDFRKNFEKDAQMMQDLFS